MGMRDRVKIQWNGQRDGTIKGTVFAIAPTLTRAVATTGGPNGNSTIRLYYDGIVRPVALLSRIRADFMVSLSSTIFRRDRASASCRGVRRLPTLFGWDTPSATVKLLAWLLSLPLALGAGVAAHSQPTPPPPPGNGDAAETPVENTAATVPQLSEEDLVAPYRQRALERWQNAVEDLEGLDATKSHPDDAILLVGSSSIRLWEDASEQMHPYHVIRRGYGGARYSDLAVFARRLITPHRFRALVIFVGNDISGREEDATPEEIEPLVRQIVATARSHQPDATIFLVEVTPTPKRFHLWPRIRQFNAMLREVAMTESNTQFIATAERYLDADDVPIATLFRDDRLHLNKTGYDLWSKLIRRRLVDAGIDPVPGPADDHSKSSFPKDGSE